MEPEVDSARWFYKEPDAKRGPVSRAQLVELLQSRAIPPDVLVWRDGMDAWTRAVDAPDLREAGFVPAAVGSGPGPRARASRKLAIVALAAWAGLIAVVVARPKKPAAREPASPHERLIAIGRKADLDSMPRVIDAIDDPDAAIASTAVTVAEGLLGVRYSEADRSDAGSLREKVQADWKVTQEHLRRRHAGKGKLQP